MAIYRATYTITNAGLGGIGTNTWHCQTPGAASEDDTDVVGPSTWIISLYEELFNLFAKDTVVAWDGIWTSVGADATVNTAGEPQTQPVGGGTHSLPPADCLVISWRTGTATRSGRGRTFLGPLNRDLLEANGTPREDLRLLTVGAAANLISDMNAGGPGTVGVYSTKQNQFRKFTNATVRNKFGSLRSRRD